MQLPVVTKIEADDTGSLWIVTGILGGSSGN